MTYTGLLSLFNGNVTGNVTNPVTGAQLPRSDLAKMYRYLCLRTIEKGSGEITGDLLEICRKLLEVSEELHKEILMELKRTGAKGKMYDAKPFILDELETIRKSRTHSIRNRKPTMVREEFFESDGDVDSDVLELEKGSLIDQMEGVESVASLGESSSLSMDYTLGGSATEILKVNDPRKKKHRGPEGP